MKIYSTTSKIPQAFKREHKDHVHLGSSGILKLAELWDMYCYLNGTRMLIAAGRQPILWLFEDGMFYQESLSEIDDVFRW